MLVRSCRRRTSDAAVLLDATSLLSSRKDFFDSDLGTRW
jgi:hypothetical protein